MSFELFAVGSTAVAASAVVYQATQGKLLNATLISFAGTTLRSFGEYLDAQKITTLGKAVILGSNFSLPGCLVGYKLYEIGGETLASLGAGWIAGIVINYSIFNKILASGAERAKKSS